MSEPIMGCDPADPQAALLQAARGALRALESLDHDLQRIAHPVVRGAISDRIVELRRAIHAADPESYGYERQVADGAGQHGV